MLSNRNIALFIDIDNANIGLKNFENAIYALGDMGSIIYTKVYGVSERKHKDIIEVITNNGYDMTHVMRIKKRGSKPLDSRILIDCIETVYRLSTVDTVAVVAGSGDLVPLFSKLKAMGKKIVCTDNCDDECLKFVDEVVDLGIVEEIKFAKRVKAPIAPKPVRAAEPKPFVVENKPIDEARPKVTPVEETFEEQLLDEQNKTAESSAEDLELLKQLDAMGKNENTLEADGDLLAQIKNLLSEFND